MKKILLIFSLFAFTWASAQTADLKTRRLGIGGFNASGTITAAGLVTLTKKIDTCTNQVDTVYFFFNATNMKNGSLQFQANLISGTGVVTGYMEVSNDGVGWWQRSVADTINLKPTANGVKCAGLAITQTNFKYIRFRFIGHNTAAVQLRGHSITKRD